jgi:hypothetical protein
MMSFTPTLLHEVSEIFEINVVVNYSVDLYSWIIASTRNLFYEGSDIY